jgi:hypothetical protein
VRTEDAVTQSAGGATVPGLKKTARPADSPPHHQHVPVAGTEASGQRLPRSFLIDGSTGRETYTITFDGASQRSGKLATVYGLG